MCCLFRPFLESSRLCRWEIQALFPFSMRGSAVDFVGAAFDSAEGAGDG